MVWKFEVRQLSVAKTSLGENTCVSICVPLWQRMDSNLQVRKDDGEGSL